MQVIISAQAERHGAQRVIGAVLAYLSTYRGAGLLLMLLFGLSAMRQVELPGLYMDAINPDYMAAQTLDGRVQNPVWRMPGPAIPILGNLYYGVQNYYVGLAVYPVLGTNIVSARIAQSLFGALIVLFTYALVRRATSSPWIALMAGAGLATDIAFVASFRTQNYIILGGTAWLLLSLLLLLHSDRPGRRGRVLLIGSGVFFGLAAYGYFVHLFFGPAVLALLLFWRRADTTRVTLLRWGGGFVLGMLPYVLGYAWAIGTLGGITPFLDWLPTVLGGLHPLSESHGYLAGLSTAFGLAHLALLNIGNELMVLGEAQSGEGLRFWPLLVVAALVTCAIALASRWRSGLRERQGLIWLAAMPLCYVLVAAIFGSRLWAHHYSVLVAFAYIVLGLALYEVHRYLRGRITAKRLVAIPIFVILACAMLWANVAQQNRFFQRLEQTGGVGMASNASTALAESALAERDRAVYLFPEWGFFMPFAFLTGNQVHYELEVTQAALSRHMGARDHVRLAFWNARDADRYRQSLSTLGVRDLRLYTFLRRDGAPALYLWAGRVPRR
jgi:4-amino-4-deoxy-L-arabinose transferase-like glycosyltransferase